MTQLFLILILSAFRAGGSPEVHLTGESLSVIHYSHNTPVRVEDVPWHLIKNVEVRKRETFGELRVQELVLICPSGVLKQVSRMRNREEVEVILPWPVTNLEQFKREIFQFTSEEHPLHQFLQRYP